MIRSVTVTNHVGESLFLELANPGEHGLSVVGITGLGPGSATINLSEIPTGDGALYNSARKSYRNIIISLRFEWADTIEETRLRTYRFFPLKHEVHLLFVTDNRKLEISGLVETNDPTIFSDTEGTDISILCPDPYFRLAGGDGLNVTTFYGIDPMFEFPFSNESTEENLLIMSEIRQETEATIHYTGDADTGVIIVIYAVGEVSNLSVHNLDTRQSMTIDDNKLIALIGSRIQDGDEITISSVTGKKTVTLLRDGKRYNILNSVGRHPNWLKLTKGDNHFAYTVDAGILNMEFRMENNILYDGV